MTGSPKQGFPDMKCTLHASVNSARVFAWPVVIVWLQILAINLPVSKFNHMNSAMCGSPEMIMSHSALMTRIYPPYLTLFRHREARAPSISFPSIRPLELPSELKRALMSGSIDMMEFTIYHNPPKSSDKSWRSVSQHFLPSLLHHVIVLFLSFLNPRKSGKIQISKRDAQSLKREWLRDLDFSDKKHEVRMQSRLHTRESAVYFCYANNYILLETWVY